jgi:Protein of unknown function (DUF1254)
VAFLLLVGVMLSAALVASILFSMLLERRTPPASRGDWWAAWNNQGTNAGDATVLYLNAMLDLSGKGRGGTKELVLTIPPSQTNYYVVTLLDAFINDVGSIGTRTTPSKRAQTYLLVGPTSRYAHDRIARIHGFTYRVMALDTNRDWLLVRIRADSLVPAADPTSAASILKNVVERFALNPLAEFEARGHRPKYFKSGQYTPTPEQIKRAAKWHTAPTNAVPFFRQVGEALRLNPLPNARTGLNGIPLRTLPAWVIPQANARILYRNPSWGQRGTLALFRPLGLTANGFTVPRNWGQAQINALQAGMNDAKANVANIANSTQVTQATNYWAYINSGIGTYPNTPEGYLRRAVFVVFGGATIPQDNVYAALNNLDGTSATTLNGNNTYKLTFTPPVTNPTSLPVVGTLPPTANDSQGNPLGFWSITVYQPDATQSAAPFISQASVLNTAYSTANIPVTAVDASTDTLTVKPSGWGPLVASTPILFGPTAAQYGLTPGVPYYVATPPDAQVRPQDEEYDVLVPGLEQVAADAIGGQRADPVQRRAGSGRHADEPGRSGQPAVGSDPAGVAAGIPAADLRRTRKEPRWVGDDLARPDAAPRGPREQLYPDPIDGVPREPLSRLRASTWRAVSVPDGDRAGNAHLLPRTRKQHTGLDPAPAEWVDERHLRVPRPPEGDLARLRLNSGPAGTGRALRGLPRNSLTGGS